MYTERIRIVILHMSVGMNEWVLRLAPASS
jgi:hypothetical protein